MASGHVNRVNRPDTWLHRPMLQNVKKALANPEPSTHGTSRTSRTGVAMSVGWVDRKSPAQGQTDANDPTRKWGSSREQTAMLYLTGWLRSVLSTSVTTQGNGTRV